MGAALLYTLRSSSAQGLDALPFYRHHIAHPERKTEFINFNGKKRWISNT